MIKTTRSLTLAGLAGLSVLLGSPNVLALPLPPSGASVATSTLLGGNTNPGSNSGLTTASNNNTQVVGNDTATARGEANSIVGSVKSSSEASGASGGGEVSASASADWTRQLMATGPVSGPIDVDLAFHVDGTLSMSEFSEGTRTGVTAILSVYTGSGGSTDVFNGRAEYRLDLAPVSIGGVTTSVVNIPILDRFGDWMGAARDADFAINSGSVAVTTNIVFEDVLSVNAGELFAVSLSLQTDALIPFAGEIFASSNFFDTATTTVSSSTPNVNFVPPGAVPEPGVLALLGIAFAGLGRRCRT